MTRFGDRPDHEPGYFLAVSRPPGYRPSPWDDPLDPPVFEAMAAYNAGVPRESLDAVRRLREMVGGPSGVRRVVVVGTNGKSSVAAYISRLLVSAGHHAGLYTSPHLRSWTERIQIDGSPVDAPDFRDALTTVHSLAAPLAESERAGDLRFFDVLTLAADLTFGAAGVPFGVFEAGIGGRLDATRVLDAELVVLTSIGADHEALLGWSSLERLREKALATPPGGFLLSAPLAPELERELPSIAVAGGFPFELLPAVDGEGFAQTNVRLARAAVERLLGSPVGGEIDTRVAGRSQRGEIDGVPYVLDVAHNPTAWRAFLDELPDEPHVAVVAVTLPRPAESLADLLGGPKLAHVIATTTSVRPTVDPADLSARAIADPSEAFEQALALARAEQLPLAVFGSNFLVVDFLAWLRDRAAS